MEINDIQKRKAVIRGCMCGMAYLGAYSFGVLPAAGAIALGGVSLDVISGALVGVLGGNAANALEPFFSLILGKEPDRLSLANEDLARAAGRAIGQIIRDVAKDKSNGYDRRTRRDLEKIADGAVENWVEIAQRETSEERYRELMERNLDELLRAEGESFVKETAMTAEAWGDVFALLNMAAHKKSQYQFDAAVGETIAQELHTRFPKALREALKDDFKKDGKAFAGLMLSLLTNIEQIDKALAVQSWRFFLSHLPGEPEGGVYRIFAPEWKQAILLWLVSDDVDVGQKEEFVRELVGFEDGCGEWEEFVRGLVEFYDGCGELNLDRLDRGFYEYRAYFLAAAGINEFRDCSFVEEIVEQIVRWGFGYFDEEIQQWRTYLGVIEEDARELLIETIRDRAIAPLEEIMATASDRDIRLEAAECLGKIVAGHEIAIAVLIKMIATTSKSYRYKRLFAASCLEEIARGNEMAIAALIEIMASTNNEDTQRLVAKCLGEIAEGNQKAIVALEELLATSSSTSIRKEAAESLGKISPGNEMAIAALADLLLSATGFLMKEKAAKSLGQIGRGNEKAMTALIEIMGTIADEEMRSTKGWGFVLDRAAGSLKKIAPRNQKAIAEIEKLLATSTSEFARRLAAECLGEIAPRNQKAIVALEELLATSTWEYNRLLGAESLEKIAPGNQKAIVALEELLATTDEELIRRKAASILGKILPGHEKAIAEIEELLATTTNEWTRSEAATYLGQIVPGSQKAIAALIEIMTTTIDHRTCSDAVWSLQNILKTNEQYCQVVCELKRYLSDNAGRINSYLFDECYSLIWHCAQNLPYPEFYRAWHGHNPDDANQTPQTFDPQQLNRALQQRQLGDTVQPYYIDGSQFVNRDNPAPEIYDQMLDAYSPQRTQGEPANMQEFKLYWKQQCRQGKPILILYEDPQPPAPQGFSETFLQALSRCGGSICVLKEGEAPPGLPTFSPADPDLIEKLVEWMESLS